MKSKLLALFLLLFVSYFVGPSDVPTVYGQSIGLQEFRETRNDCAPVVSSDFGTGIYYKRECSGNIFGQNEFGSFGREWNWWNIGQLAFDNFWVGDPSPGDLFVSKTGCYSPEERFSTAVDPEEDLFGKQKPDNDQLLTKKRCIEAVDFRIDMFRVGKEADYLLCMGSDYEDDIDDFCRYFDGYTLHRANDTDDPELYVPPLEIEDFPDNLLDGYRYMPLILDPKENYCGEYGEWHLGWPYPGPPTRVNKNWVFDRDDVYGIGTDAMDGIAYEDLIDPENKGWKYRNHQCLKLYVQEWAHRADCGDVVLQGAPNYVGAGHCLWAKAYNAKDSCPQGTYGKNQVGCAGDDDPPAPRGGSRTLRSEAFDYFNFDAGGWNEWDEEKNVCQYMPKYGSDPDEFLYPEIDSGEKWISFAKRTCNAFYGPYGFPDTVGPPYGDIKGAREPTYGRCNFMMGINRFYRQWDYPADWPADTSCIRNTDYTIVPEERDFPCEDMEPWRFHRIDGPWWTWIRDLDSDVPEQVDSDGMPIPYWTADRGNKAGSWIGGVDERFLARHCEAHNIGDRDNSGLVMFTDDPDGPGTGGPPFDGNFFMPSWNNDWDPPITLTSLYGSRNAGVNKFGVKWCEFEVPLEPQISLHPTRDINNSRTENLDLNLSVLERIRDVTCERFSQRLWWEYDHDPALPKFFGFYIDSNWENPFTYNTDIRTQEMRCGLWDGTYHKIYGKTISGLYPVPTSMDLISYRLPRFDYEFLRTFKDCTGPWVEWVVKDDWLGRTRNSACSKVNYECSIGMCAGYQLIGVTGEPYSGICNCPWPDGQCFSNNDKTKPCPCDPPTGTCPHDTLGDANGDGTLSDTRSDGPVNCLGMKLFDATPPPWLIGDGVHMGCDGDPYGNTESWLYPWPDDPWKFTIYDPLLWDPPSGAPAWQVPDLCCRPIWEDVVPLDLPDDLFWCDCQTDDIPYSFRCNEAHCNCQQQLRGPGPYEVNYNPWPGVGGLKDCWVDSFQTPVPEAEERLTVHPWGYLYERQEDDIGVPFGWEQPDLNLLYWGAEFRVPSVGSNSGPAPRLWELGTCGGDANNLPNETYYIASRPLSYWGDGFYTSCNPDMQYRRWFGCFAQARGNACPILERPVSNGISPPEAVIGGAAPGFQSIDAEGVFYSRPSTNVIRGQHMRWTLPEPNMLSYIDVTRDSAGFDEGRKASEMVYETQTLSENDPYMSPLVPNPFSPYGDTGELKSPFNWLDKITTDATIQTSTYYNHITRASDSIIGPRGCDIGGWYEMMLYQARCIRLFKLNCMCDYNKTFASGMAEAYVLKRGGAQFNAIKFDKLCSDGTEGPPDGPDCKDGKDPIDFKREVTLIWPLMWRGYASPLYGKMCGNMAARIWRWTIPNYGGLDCARVGDFIIWDEQLQDINTDTDDVVFFTDARSRRHIAFVEWTSWDLERDSDDSFYCTTVEEDIDKVKLMEITEWNWGKNLDACGVTNRWKTLTHRTVFKDQIQAKSERPHQNLPGGGTEVKNPMPDFAWGDDDEPFEYGLCNDADLQYCWERNWDRIKVYRHLKDHFTNVLTPFPPPVKAYYPPAGQEILVCQALIANPDLEECEAAQHPDYPECLEWDPPIPPDCAECPELVTNPDWEANRKHPICSAPKLLDQEAAAAMPENDPLQNYVDLGYYGYDRLVNALWDRIGLCEPTLRRGGSIRLSNTQRRDLTMGAILGAPARFNPSGLMQNNPSVDTGAPYNWPCFQGDGPMPDGCPINGIPVPVP